MERQKRAFISYRRNDQFASDHGPAVDGNGVAEEFVVAFQQKLKKSGFDHVFLDQLVIESGQGWLDVIFDEVSSCDAVVLIIGKKWLQILNEKAKQGGHDILLEEIVVALSHDRNIIPVLVDGATMPHRGLLPKKIRAISYIQAMEVNSDDTEDVIAKKFFSLFSDMENQKNLGAPWRQRYLQVGVLAWLLTGILPNLVGILEFGWSTWCRLALIWGGLFVWPIFFIPFAMLGLYQPISGLMEQIIRSGTRARKLRYTAPFAFAIAIGFVGATIDILAGEVIWTVKPRAGSVCGIAGPVPEQAKTLPPSSDVLYTYDKAPDKYLSSLYKSEFNSVPFWLQDENKCYPNAFFFIVDPMLTKFKSNKNYLDERILITKEYRRIEKYDSEAKEIYERSYTFFMYGISMFVMLTLMAMGVIFALYYVLFGVDDPKNKLRKLKMPVENAYLGLLFAYISLMMWHPFRIITNYYKSLTCSDVSGEKNCLFTVENMFNDSFLFFFVMTGYIIITVGLFVEERRKRIIIINLFTVVAIIAITLFTYIFRAEIPDIINRYQLSLIILASLVLLFIWISIDPGKMRKESFKSKFPELE